MSQHRGPLLIISDFSPCVSHRCLSACLYFILLFKQKEEIIHVSCELVPWNKNEERAGGEGEVLLRDVGVETSRFIERAIGNLRYTFRIYSCSFLMVWS